MPVNRNIEAFRHTGKLGIQRRNRAGDAFYRRHSFLDATAREGFPRSLLDDGSMYIFDSVQNRNLLRDTHDFTSATWVAPEVSYDPVTFILTDTVTSGFHSFYQDSFASHGLVPNGTVMTSSILIKTGLYYDTLYGAIVKKDGTSVSATFTTTYESVSLLTADAATMTAVGDGWYLATVTQDVGSGTTPPRAEWYMIDGDQNRSFVGTGNTILVKNPQFEVGAAAESYQARTNHQDVIDLLGQNHASLGSVGSIRAFRRGDGTAGIYASGVTGIGTNTENDDLFELTTDDFEVRLDFTPIDVTTATRMYFRMGKQPAQFYINTNTNGHCVLALRQNALNVTHTFNGVAGLTSGERVVRRFRVDQTAQECYMYDDDLTLLDTVAWSDTVNPIEATDANENIIYVIGNHVQENTVTGTIHDVKYWNGGYEGAGTKRFDLAESDITGDTATITTTSGHTLTITQPTADTTADPILLSNGRFRFVDDYINTKITANPSEWTIISLARTLVGNTNQNIVSKRDVATEGWFVGYKDSDNTFYAKVMETGNVTTVGEIEYLVGKYHLAILSSDGITISFWVDGNLLGTTPIASYDASSAAMGIGRNVAGTAYLEGDAQLVKHLPTSFTQADVDIMQAAIEASPTFTIGYEEHPIFTTLDYQGFDMSLLDDGTVLAFDSIVNKNLLQFTDMADQWDLTAVTASSNQVRETVATSAHRISALDNFSIPAAETSVTLTWRVKPVGGRNLYCRIRRGVDGLQNLAIDGSDGSILGATGSSWTGTSSTADGDYYIIKGTCAIPAGAADSVDVWLQLYDGATASYAGDITKGFDDDYIQLEYGSTATSYQARTNHQDVIDQQSNNHASLGSVGSIRAYKKLNGDAGIYSSGATGAYASISYDAAMNIDGSSGLSAMVELSNLNAISATQELARMYDSGMTRWFVFRMNTANKLVLIIEDSIAGQITFFSTVVQTGVQSGKFGAYMYYDGADTKVDFWKDTGSGATLIDTVTHAAANLTTNTPTSGDELWFGHSTLMLLGATIHSFSISAGDFRTIGYSNLYLNESDILGDTATISTSSGHTLTLTQPSADTTADPTLNADGSLSFDGGDYIDTGITDNPAAWTVSVIARWTGGTGTTRHCLAKRTGSNASGWHIVFNSADSIRFAVQDTGTNNISANIAATIDTYYHMVLTSDGTTLECWVNGDSKGTLAVSGNYAEGSENLIIGALSSSGNFGFDGDILGPVKILENAVVQADVDEMYAAAQDLYGI